MFDLNIENYSKKELEGLLELDTSYDKNMLHKKSLKIIQNILNDTTTNLEIKDKTINFIKEVENKLIINNSFDNVSSILKNTLSSSKAFYNLDKELKNVDTTDVGNRFLINQRQTPYANSLPSEIYEGVLNPLTRRVLRQNINIDTRFRENYYNTQSTNFHYELPLRLTQVVSLQLTALELPTSFYVISKHYGNHFFALEIENLDPLIVVIPDGNYDYLSLQNYINNYLSSAVGLYNTINVVIDINTPSGTSGGGSGRMVFGSTTGTLNFALNFTTDIYGNNDTQTPLPLKLGWLMGFRQGYYINNVSYVSEGLVDLTGIRYIYLVIDDYNKSVSDGYYGAFNASLLNKNIIARISLQGGTFNIFSQSNFNIVTTPRQYFGPVDIQKLQIQLLDEYGRIIELNNMDYSFNLTFQTIYDL
jgi:hypothetical protein